MFFFLLFHRYSNIYFIRLSYTLQSMFVKLLGLRIRFIFFGKCSWFVLITLVIEKPLEDLDLQKGICYYYRVKYLKSPFSPALLFPRSCLCIKYALISFFSLPLHSFYLQSSLSLNYKVVHSMSPTLPLLFTFLFSLCLSSSQT